MVVKSAELGEDGKSGGGASGINAPGVDWLTKMNAFTHAHFSRIRSAPAHWPPPPPPDLAAAARLLVRAAAHLAASVAKL